MNTPDIHMQMRTNHEEKQEDFENVLSEIEKKQQETALRSCNLRWKQTQMHCNYNTA